VIDSTLAATRFVSPQIRGSGDAEKLETILGPIDGIRDVTANPDDHSVCVTYNMDVVDRNGIMSALQREGFAIESANNVSPSEGATSPSLLS